ncbi:MAG: hypothetical protein ACI9MC_003417 [Kiritimatiellia bacterium]|jgi:hypothetical protein
MFQGVTDIIQGLAQILPPEVLAAVLVIALVAAFPAWLHTVRTKQIKAYLRRAARAENDDLRQQLYEKAFAIAKARPRRLAALAELAIEKQLTPVWTRALRELEQTGKAELDALRLRRSVSPKRNAARDALELEVRVDSLMADGLFVAAQEIVDHALSNKPNDPKLASLHSLVHAALPDPDEIRPDRELP